MTPTRLILLARLLPFCAAVLVPSFAIAQEPIDWEERQGCFLLEAHGGVWDFLYGGGGSMGFEIASKDILVGIGARSGFSGWVGEDDHNWDYTDMTWDNDVWIPLRLPDYSLTLYGGIGVTLHDMECEGLVESSSYYRSGRTRRYTYSLKTVDYSHGANTSTHAWFVGLRWRVNDHFFLFGEYRQTRGTIEMSTNDLDSYSKYKDLVVDMDQSCFLFGFGGAF